MTLTIWLAFLAQLNVLVLIVVYAGQRASMWFALGMADLFVVTIIVGFAAQRRRRAEPLTAAARTAALKNILDPHGKRGA